MSLLPWRAERGRYLQIVFPAKAGIQGLGHPSTTSARTTCRFTYPCQPLAEKVRMRGIVPVTLTSILSHQGLRGVGIVWFQVSGW